MNRTCPVSPDGRHYWLLDGPKWIAPGTCKWCEEKQVHTSGLPPIYFGDLPAGIPTGEAWRGWKGRGPKPQREEMDQNDTLQER